MSGLGTRYTNQRDSGPTALRRAEPLPVILSDLETRVPLALIARKRKNEHDMCESKSTNPSCEECFYLSYIDYRCHPGPPPETRLRAKQREFIGGEILFPHEQI